MKIRHRLGWCCDQRLSSLGNSQLFTKIQRIFVRGFDAFGAGLDSLADADFNPLQIGMLFLFDGGVIVAAQ